MVLLSQAEWSDGEMGLALRAQREAIPLDQHVEQRHGEGQTHREVAPDAMEDLLEVCAVALPQFKEQFDLPAALASDLHTACDARRDPVPCRRPPLENGDLHP